MAKGGGGGGDGCAQILSFSNTPGSNADGTPTITTAYTVQQGCIDTFGAPVALDFKNNSTGFTGREVNMTPLGTWSYSRTWNATPGVKFTITLTVYKPGGGGKVEATQTQTVTAPA